MIYAIAGEYSTYRSKLKIQRQMVETISSIILQNKRTRPESPPLLYIYSELRRYGRLFQYAFLFSGTSKQSKTV